MIHLALITLLILFLFSFVFPDKFPILIPITIYLIIVLILLKEKYCNFKDWEVINKRDENIELEKHYKNIDLYDFTSFEKAQHENKIIKENYNYERNKKKRERDRELILSLLLK
jgi:hypothetical protein